MIYKELDLFFGLDLVLENKPIWPDYSSLLADAFSLVSINSSKKRFEDYLSSPFFIGEKDPMRGPLLKLFSYLYPRFSKKLTKGIRIKGVLWETYKSRDFEKDKRKLRTLMKRLYEEILRFNAYCHLEEQPEELCRLRTLSLRNKGVSEQYRSEQTAWEKAAATLPIGTHGALHRWASRDAGYMGLDVPKSKFDADAFQDIWSTLNAFVSLQGSLYELEVARRPEIREKLTCLTEQAKVSGHESELNDMYRQISNLLETKTTDPTAYRQLKRRFLAHGNSFDVEHRMAVTIGLLNHLQDLYTKGDLRLQSEMYFWPHMMLKSKSHQLIPVIPKQQYNNQLHRALINNQLWLAKRLREELSPRLPLSDRDYVEEHTQLAFDFHEGRHNEVIHAVWASSMARFRTDNHDEVIRLKSYHIRSLLVCLVDKPADEYLNDSIVKALKALDKYIETYGEEQLLGLGDKFLRYRRFRTVARLVYSYLKERPYQKSASTDKIIVFINEEEPLACRNWFMDFVFAIG